jgi:hypothetical protein
MKSVRVIQAHKDYDGLWQLEGDKTYYLTTAADFIIQDHVGDWPSVAIAYSNSEFPDTVSKITYLKSIKLSSDEHQTHMYHYEVKGNNRSSSRDGRKNNISILMSDELIKYFSEIPKNIFFKIFKI